MSEYVKCFETKIDLLNYIKPSENSIKGISPSPASGSCYDYYYVTFVPPVAF